MMQQENNTQRFLLLVGFILLVGVSRVFMSVGHTPLSNFTPIGAMALYGGAYLKGYNKFLFPLLTLWISDLFINRFVYYNEWTLFYDGFFWTYGAFALMVLIGVYLMKKVTVKNFIVSSLVIVFIHWIVTDFGVWAGTSMYPKTIQGFWMCLVAAIPFERNFLAGTVLYGSVMFGALEWLQAKFTSLKSQEVVTN